MKVYIASNGNGGFSEYINWIKDAEETNNLQEADLVLFAGGEDVDPSLYGEPVHRTTSKNSYRDEREIEIWRKAQERNIPILGICRGSQFTCVMAGGSLVQNQDNPKYFHKMTVEGEDKPILITSTHHQAQYPYNMGENEYRVIGYTQGISAFHVNGYDEELNPEKECEIVFYPNEHALGIQGHPEKLLEDRNYFERKLNAEENVLNECNRTINYCNQLVSKLLNNTL